MKIAYVAAVLKKSDGVSHVLAELVKESKLHNHEVLVITGQHDPDFVIDCEVKLLPSVRIPLYPEYSFPLFVKNKIRKILKEYNPDVIHVHSPDPASYFAKHYAIENGVRIIATHHTNFLSYLVYYKIGFLKPFVSFLLQKFYRSIDAVTTPSESTAQDLQKLGVLARVVGWGIDLETFNPTFRSDQWRKEITKGKDETILFCAARLVWYKGFKILAETYAKIKQEFPDVRLVIAGDGPIRNELQKLYPELLFLGVQKGIDLSTSFASSDIFVFPSTTETFGSVTLEAMASGLPVIVSDKGGFCGLIKSSDLGIVFAADDSDSLYYEIKRLLTSEELRKKYALKGFEYAQKQTWKQVFKTFEEIYKNEVV